MLHVRHPAQPACAPPYTGATPFRRTSPAVTLLLDAAGARVSGGKRTAGPIRHLPIERDERERNANRSPWRVRERASERTVRARSPRSWAPGRRVTQFARRKTAYPSRVTA